VTSSSSTRTAQIRPSRGGGAALEQHHVVRLDQVGHRVALDPQREPAVAQARQRQVPSASATASASGPGRDRAKQRHAGGGGRQRTIGERPRPRLSKVR
jgi:hypothetical protein